VVIVGLIVAPDFIYADQKIAFNKLMEVERPVAEECAKQVRQKCGSL